MDQKLSNDFPIDWEEDHFVSRREFFKFMTLASGGLALGSTALALWSKEQRNSRSFDRTLLAKVDDLAVGASLGFSYPRPQDICILIRHTPENFVAYSRRCTHLSCPVEYQPDQNRLYCPCHNGAFAVTDGSVLQGPPPHPLTEIVLEVHKGQIFATGVRNKGENS